MIWRFAISHGYTVVTKDVDFYDRALLADVSSKILWTRLHNCPTRQVETLLRMRYQQIAAFHQQTLDTVLALP